MARSKYVYQAARGGATVGMFTVKHEAEAAIRKSASQWVNSEHRIYRWPDGPYDDIRPPLCKWDPVAMNFGPWLHPYTYEPIR